MSSPETLPTTTLEEVEYVSRHYEHPYGPGAFEPRAVESKTPELDRLAELEEGLACAQALRTVLG